MTVACIEKTNTGCADLGKWFQKGNRKVVARNIALIFLTAMAVIAAVFAVSVISFHSWMLLPFVGLSLCFCVNNLPYFWQAAPKVPVAAEVPVLPAAPALSDEEVAESLVQEMSKHLEYSIQLTHGQINDGQNSHIRNRDKGKIAKQFQKDNRRRGCVAIEDLRGNVRFPTEENHLYLQDQLRALASPDEVLNEDLFLSLQEAFSQTAEAAPAIHLDKLFRKERGYIETVIVWNKMGVKLKQIGLTTFEVSYIYNVALKTPHNGKSIEHRVIVVQKLDPTGITQLTRSPASQEDFRFVSISPQAYTTSKQLSERS